ncbi:type II/IV secretion system ATPase subunit [Methanosarcina sp. KYL-1]|nr:type II/IV secretion system ATPase subunit [Methanosarcina sp. KYL-1]
MDLITKLRDTVSALSPGLFGGQDKEEEELCPYRSKQTKNRKTIIINCKECGEGSSLNNEHCRRNILEILQKEVHADCLVLSRLYERDYEGEALSVLYALAGFRESIEAYRSTETVPEECMRPEKKGCGLERKEVLDFLTETAEKDPLKTRLELRGLVRGNGLRKVPDASPGCEFCSECFYDMLREMKEKARFLPEIPAQINSVIPAPLQDIKAGGNEKAESEKTVGKKARREKAGNLMQDISGEISFSWKANPTSNPYQESDTASDTASDMAYDMAPAPGKKENNKELGTFAAAFFDYENRIKPHVRPPFSTSRIYTEAPQNTEFLECYDMSGKDGRMLEVSIYRYTDRPEKLYMVRPPEYNLRPGELMLLEKVRKRMIRHRPKDLAFADPTGAREYFRRMAKDLLVDELLSGGETCTPGELESYSDLLARYTNGLGIVEDLLSDARVTDVYINAPADKNPVHVVMEGEECTSNVFLSQDDLDSLVSRFRTISGRPFGEAVPVLELNLEAFGVRVSVIGDPLSASGLAYAFRKHSLSPWTLPKLINTGSVSAYAAGFLSFLMDGQASVLIAGEVGAGKTSLLSSMLLEIPQKYRILTIEDTHELPTEKLQELGWKVQGMSSHSSVLKSGAEMSPETALRAALRLGSSSLVIGEVRGPEVKVLYEAMQVGNAGNSVIGTIHGSSTENVYERIVHTLGVPPASFKATDAVIICSGIRPGGTMKKLKRVSRIAEVTAVPLENPEPGELFTDIMSYDASQDCLLAGEVLEQGQSELIGKIARKWGISIGRALKNIEIRARIKDKIAKEGDRRPSLLEAEAVSEANNMFWLLTDSLKGRKKTGRKASNEANFKTDSDNVSDNDSDNDYENNYENDFDTDNDYENDFEAEFEALYSRWEAWFENFAGVRRGNVPEIQDNA